jgi:enamine deaminase RidA (YjgF/YER057c/UK114 family)
MDIARFSSGSPWEARVGYSRALRVGDRIYVSGTTGVLADGEPAQGLEAQARRAIDVISGALTALGGSLDTVVRTRTYLTDISGWAIVGRVHSEAFSIAMPVATMVEVSALIDPRLLVEIEVEAIVGGLNAPDSGNLTAACGV